LMFSWKELKNPQTAILFGKQSVNNYQEIRREIQLLKDSSQKNFLQSVENAYRELADLLIEQGEFSQANQVLRMLKEEEFFDFVRRDANEIKNLNQRVLLNENEKEIVSRYTFLADRVAEIGSEFLKLDEKKRQLSRQDKTLSPTEQIRYEKLSGQLSDANAAFKLFLEKTLIAELGKERAKNIDYDRNLQAKLRKWGDGTVVLYTALTANRYRVVLTTPNVQIDGKTEIKVAELNKKIFEFRQALRDIKTDPRILGKELYDILIKPLEKQLQATGAKTLVWSLDGTLRYIPLAALSPDGKSYFAEKYQNVIITPKTRDDLSDTDTEWEALGVGISESQTVVNPDNPRRTVSE
jgi:CHAT domain-containing protein